MVDGSGLAAQVHSPGAGTFWLDGLAGAGAEVARVAGRSLPLLFIPVEVLKECDAGRRKSGGAVENARPASHAFNPTL